MTVIGSIIIYQVVASKLIASSFRYWDLQLASFISSLKNLP